MPVQGVESDVRWPAKRRSKGGGAIDDSGDRSLPPRSVHLASQLNGARASARRSTLAVAAKYQGRWQPARGSILLSTYGAYSSGRNSSTKESDIEGEALS